MYFPLQLNSNPSPKQLLSSSQDRLHSLVVLPASSDVHALLDPLDEKVEGLCHCSSRGTKVSQGIIISTSSLEGGDEILIKSGTQTLLIKPTGRTTLPWKCIPIGTHLCSQYDLLHSGGHHLAGLNKLFLAKWRVNARSQDLRASNESLRSQCCLLGRHDHLVLQGLVITLSSHIPREK